MRTTRSFITRFVFATATIALAASLTTPKQADASTAQNTKITNIATVNYRDASNVAQPAKTATADVIVLLKASAPNFGTAPGNQSITQGDTASITYTIIGTSNGVDIYNLSAAEVSTGIGATVPTFPGGNTITLGGTTLAATALVGAVSITVPYDNNADANANGTNGIIVGSKIMIAGVVYTVSAVTENAVANTTVIGLTAPLTVGAALGDIVGEQKTFTVSVPSGLLSAPPASGTQAITLTATSQTDGTMTKNQAAPTITVTIASLSITKTVSIDNGTTYLASVNAKPGDTLIYKILITNGGSGDATVVKITDPLNQYITYVSASAKSSSNTASTYVAAAGPLTDLNAVDDGYDYGVTTAGTVTYTIPITIIPLNGYVLFYKATVN